MKTRKRAVPVIKPYVINHIALMPPSYIMKRSRRIIWCGNKVIEDLNLVALLNQYAGGREIELSSDDAEDPDPRILQEGL